MAGANSFAYVSNQPVISRDPSGAIQIVTSSESYRARLQSAIAMIRQQMLADPGRAICCNNYFREHAGSAIGSLGTWMQDGGPPYLFVVSRPATVSSDKQAYAQKGSPFLYINIFADVIDKNPVGCALASLIVHEAGHLARQDMHDNEPQDFFNACRFGCIEPGKYR